MASNAYAVIRPTQEQYTKMVGAMAATNATAWLDGAAMAFTSGLLVEATRATMGGYASGAIPQTTLAALLVGFAASPFTLAITASGGSAIGAETLPKVGSGTAQTGVRRTFYSVKTTSFWTGSIDTSGGQGTALAATDVGTMFNLAPVLASSGAITANKQWIVDRTALANAFMAVVTRLIDPIGATSADTPISGINSGQAVVEFSIAPLAWGL
jgi:hypothetical protein